MPRLRALPVRDPRGCHQWFDHELALVQPTVVVALGATAGRSVFGHPIRVGESRGTVHELEPVGAVIVTIHPSAVLRARGSDDREALLDGLVDDLRLAARTTRSARPPKSKD